MTDMRKLNNNQGYRAFGNLRCLKKLSVYRLDPELSEINVNLPEDFSGLLVRF